MLSRGKIAWLGVLVLAVLVTFRGENVLYRVWTTRHALATVEQKDQRSVVERELSGIPVQREVLVGKKNATDSALSALRLQQNEAKVVSRELRKKASLSQRAELQAQREVKTATSVALGTYRKTGDRTLRVSTLLAALKTGKTAGLPSILSPLIEKIQTAQSRVHEEWEQQKVLVAKVRTAVKEEQNLRMAVGRLAQESQRLAGKINALDRRKLLLHRRLVVLSRPRTIVREAAPKPTSVVLKGTAKLSGAVGDTTTPLLFSDLSKDQSTLDAFLSVAAKAQKKLDWPISPDTEGISAYYHDELYVAKMGQDHFAIDIVADQGTEIVAPADSLVLKAEDSGTGFQYILLLHKNGYVTLYGHVSSFTVEAGDLVRRGAILGTSGGKPGTVGAGNNTTGPHLHLEVWKDNKRLDPLLYLDLTKLPKDPVKVDPDQIPSASTTDLDH